MFAKYKSVLVVVMMLVVAGCKSKKIKHSKDIQDIVHVVDDMGYIESLQSIITELPELPLGYTMDYKKEKATTGSIIYWIPIKHYRSLDVDQLKDQLTQDMEALGWHLKHVSNTNSMDLLVFEKPSKKICLLQIHQHSKEITFTIPKIQK